MNACGAVGSALGVEASTLENHSSVSRKSASTSAEKSIRIQMSTQRGLLGEFELELRKGGRGGILASRIPGGAPPSSAASSLFTLSFSR